jgi:hypothetical protein
MIDHLSLGVSNLDRALRSARTHLIAVGAVMREPHSDGACDGLDPEGNVFHPQVGDQVGDSTDRASKGVPPAPQPSPASGGGD